MYQGQDMLGPKTLEENGIVLPGPMQRRAGAVTEIFFDLAHEEVVRQERAEAEFRKDAERRRMEEVERRRQEKRKSIELQKQLERDRAFQVRLQQEEEQRA